MENEDFMLVPAEAWHKLLAWYGVVDGQPPLERKVTSLRGRYTPDTCQIQVDNLTLCVFVCVCQVVDLPSTLKVEVYPIEIFLCLHSNMENVVTLQFSRTDNIRELVCACVCVRVYTAVVTYSLTKIGEVVKQRQHMSDTLSAFHFIPEVLPHQTGRTDSLCMCALSC